MESSFQIRTGRQLPKIFFKNGVASLPKYKCWSEHLVLIPFGNDSPSSLPAHTSWKVMEHAWPSAQMLWLRRTRADYFLENPLWVRVCLQPQPNPMDTWNQVSKTYEGKLWWKFSIKKTIITNYPHHHSEKFQRVMRGRDMVAAVFLDTRQIISPMADNKSRVLVNTDHQVCWI